MNLRYAMTVFVLMKVLSTTTLAITIDSYPDVVQAGKSYMITYSANPMDQVNALLPSNAIVVTNAVQPVTFKLQHGRSETPSAPEVNIVDLSVYFALTGSSQIIGTARGGSFNWTVNRSLLSANDYALQVLTADEQVNYSGWVSLTGDSIDVASSALPPAASSARSTSSASPTGSAVSTGESPNPTPSTNTGGLTPGEKAGIGVGVSIGALSLALSAFLLGKYLRKESKQSIDTEGGNASEKPELEGNSTCHEMSVDSMASKVIELSGHFDQAAITLTKLVAERERQELDSLETPRPPHELHANVAASTITQSERTGPASSNTDEEPRLMPKT